MGWSDAGQGADTCRASRAAHETRWVRSNETGRISQDDRCVKLESKMLRKSERTSRR